MSDPKAYNDVTKINPPLASAIYQYNAISNAKPSNDVDPMLLQQNAYQEQISRTIYIGNLHPSIVEDQLIKVFGTCGIINLAKVASEGMGLKANAGTKFGFIEYADRKGAEAAIGLDGVLLGGRPVRVGPSNGPIIQPTAYGPGAATMRNRPPLFKVSEGGFIILDQKAEDDINSRIDSKLKSALERLNRKYTKSSDSNAPPSPSKEELRSLPPIPAKPIDDKRDSAPRSSYRDSRRDSRRDYRSSSRSRSRHHSSYHSHRHHSSRDRSRSRHSRR